MATIAAFEAAVLVGFGALVFGVPWGNSPAAVILTLGSLVLAATGLGIMMSALVRTRDQLSALVPVVSTAMAMIGGCYWPVEITPPFMQSHREAHPNRLGDGRAQEHGVSRHGCRGGAGAGGGASRHGGGVLRGGPDEAQARVGTIREDSGAALR